MIDAQAAAELREYIWERGRELYRPMPWRDDTRAYYVLVSELMLQQTQVARVVPKFEAFVERFPDIATLAAATPADVLALWSGLGYNRRALYLHAAAQAVVREHQGVLPDNKAALVVLPGIGPNTAGALLAYAYNQPVVYIETNVRTVYLYHCFSDAEAVYDRDIAAVADMVLDRESPREFYWALMDYGAWLKSQGVRINAQSKHYKKQSQFKGSVREVRGIIVRELTKQGALPRARMQQVVADDTRFEAALAGLVRDGLVMVQSDVIDLTK